MPINVRRGFNMFLSKIQQLGDGVDPKDAVNKSQLDGGVALAENRANHTGTQLSSTISDLGNTIQSYRLDQLVPPSNAVNFNGQQLTSLADPTTAQGAATKGYVDAQLSASAAGMTLKGAVRAASTANVNLASPGASIDGLAAQVGDVFLLTGQSTASQNGPYVWNGAAAAMTRASSFDTSAEAALGSFWIVEAGSKADNFAVLTNDAAITLGTTGLAFTFSNLAAGNATNNFAYTVGDGTSTTFNVPHMLGTYDVQVSFYSNLAPRGDLLAEVNARPDVNNITVIFDTAPSAGEIRVLVQKVA